MKLIELMNDVSYQEMLKIAGVSVLVITSVLGLILWLTRSPSAKQT